MNGSYRWLAALVLAAFLGALSPASVRAQDGGFRGWRAPAEVPERKWAFTIFHGQMSNRSFLGTLTPLNGEDRADIYFNGAALSRFLGTWRYLSFEAETGAGYQYADGTGNDTGQIWVALYARYSNFPWNKWIKTTIGVNTGLNYAFKQTDFEESFKPREGTKNLLHYLAPEVTFALPEFDRAELVVRLHHRSAVSGLFGCHDCRNNTVAVGLRARF